MSSDEEARKKTNNSTASILGTPTSQQRTASLATGSPPGSRDGLSDSAADSGSAALSDDEATSKAKAKAEAEVAAAKAKAEAEAAASKTELDASVAAAAPAPAPEEGMEEDAPAPVPAAAAPPDLVKLAAAKKTILDSFLEEDGSYKFIHFLESDSESESESESEIGEEAPANESEAVGGSLYGGAVLKADEISTNYPEYIPVDLKNILVGNTRGTDVAEAIQKVLTLPSYPAILGLKRDQWEKPDPTVQCNSAGVRPSDAAHKKCWLCGNPVNMGANAVVNGKRMSVCNPDENRFDCEHVLPGIFMLFLKMMRNKSLPDTASGQARDAELYASSCHMCNTIKSDKLYIKAEWVNDMPPAPAGLAAAAAAMDVVGEAVAPVAGTYESKIAEQAIAFARAERFNNLVRATIQYPPPGFVGANLDGSIDVPEFKRKISSYEAGSLARVIPPHPAGLHEGVAAVQVISDNGTLLINGARLASLRAAGVPLRVDRESAWSWISNRFVDIHSRITRVCNYLNDGGRNDAITTSTKSLATQPLLNIATSKRLGAQGLIKLPRLPNTKRAATAAAAAAAAAPARLIFKPNVETIMTDILLFILSLRVGETTEISRVEGDNADLPELPGLTPKYSEIKAAVDSVKLSKAVEAGVVDSMDLSREQKNYKKDKLYITKIADIIQAGEEPFGKADMIPTGNPSWPTPPDGNFPMCSGRPAVHFYKMTKKGEDVSVERSTFTSIAAVAGPVDGALLGRLSGAIPPPDADVVEAARALVGLRNPPPPPPEALMPVDGASSDDASPPREAKRQKTGGFRFTIRRRSGTRKTKKNRVRVIEVSV
jgi:hypothetical protein